ncbi:hatching enzyme 1.2-like [Diabrotica undecimpunctata]|uniref:hatching enzyme 1.2-like n=1 Tax=Diabrotica undecimpunctata TaxID=50387 RepID=UPI003B63BB58
MSKYILHIVLLITLIFVKDIVNKTVKKASANYTNPEENEEFYEGDILIPESSLRNGIVGETFRWDKGIIPYVIAGNFTAEQIKIIHRAFATFHEYTCIKFIPRSPNDQYYINITDEIKSYCFSFIGRQLYRKQTVNLGNRCFKKLGTTIHELMHAVGFWHEQSRTDRDKFVDVVRRNIKKGMENNFHKTRNDVNFGQPYDYESILHYNPKAFTTNGNYTIVPKDKTLIRNMGQRIGLSKIDIAKINLMYNCPEKTREILHRPAKFFVARGKE